MHNGHIHKYIHKQQQFKNTNAQQQIKQHKTNTKKRVQQTKDTHNDQPTSHT